MIMIVKGMITNSLLGVLMFGWDVVLIANNE